MTNAVIVDNLIRNDDDQNNDDDIREDRVIQSHQKLENAAQSFLHIIPKTNIHIHSCQTIDDTYNYRCKCTFQIIQQKDCNNDNNHGNTLYYAIHFNGKPIIINNNQYTICSHRMQNVMNGLLYLFNVIIQNQGILLPIIETNNNNNNSRDYRILIQNLTSITFASSWNGILDNIQQKQQQQSYDNTNNNGILLSNKLFDVMSSHIIKSDCVMTLHYNQPIIDINNWKICAQQICIILNCNQITGRSRKSILRVSKQPDTTIKIDSSINNNNNNNEWLIRDKISIIQYSTEEEYYLEEENNNMSTKKKKMTKWKVTTCYDNTDNETNYNYNNDNNETVYYVIYKKAQDAFFHPNAKVMCIALEWMLERISLIINNNETSSLFQLIEMYCGCGAHTIPIAKTNIFHTIIAIEYDERLVQTFQSNCHMNHISTTIKNNNNNKNEWDSNPNNNATSITDDDDINQEMTAATTATYSSTTIEIILEDAGQWARNQMESTTLINNSDDTHKEKMMNNNNFNVLLVDPPRQGLSNDVIQMIIHNDNDNICFQHILYISCGKDALIHDLTILSIYYDIINCIVLDLFPGTTSVETLVHLKRKGTIEK